MYNVGGRGCLKGQCYLLRIILYREGIQIKKSAFLLWIFILAIELFSLYSITYRPHDISEIIFNTILITVTLVVGVTAVFAFKENS